MHRMTTEWPQALSCQKYPVYTEYSPRGTNFTSFSTTTSHFRDTRLPKIANSPNDPRMNHLTVKSCLHWKFAPGAQISLGFAEWTLVFQIIEVFGFHIGYNGEFKKKSLNIRKSTIQNSTFVLTTEKKIQKKFQKIQKCFDGRVPFLFFFKFLLP